MTSVAHAPPSPHLSGAMSNRVPLANIATNSPLRPAGVVGGKRQRSTLNEARDVGQPPAKKHIVAVDDAESRRHGLIRRSGAPATALTRKLEAARESKAPPKQVERVQRVSGDIETIRQWQKHYRRLFPAFRFFFDSVSSTQKDRIMSKASILGSREIAFFSKEATHVITTRPIPADIDSSSSSHTKGTVNPSQLDTAKSIFDKPSARGDVLYKAKELGMKIWTVDKIQRMVDTMFNKDTGEDPSSLQTRQSVAVQQKGRPADLQRLLQNEKMDRDYILASQDLIPLRGFYVYVHDMDEATRPVMIREYQKVEKDKGKWPQFRASGNGRCPFVDDPNFGRRQQEEEARRVQKAAAATAAPRTRAASAIEQKLALGENNNLARRPSAVAEAVLKHEQDTSKVLGPPQALPAKRASTDSGPPMFGSAQAGLRAMPRFIAGEPVASGLQASNITSAIRSQMISSTAAAPRAGNSKEVNALKRKVLEKNSVPPSANTNSCQSSAMNDVRAMLNQEHVPPTRAAKRKAQETLGFIHEDEEAERQARKAAALRRRKTAEKELKPGYCENCREKFNDFDEVRQNIPQSYLPS
jgi:regulatory subunit for Cdc7p protein kinase